MFPCDCCGLCCRQVRTVPEFAKDYDRGDGVCKYLNENNRCSVYDNRPEICNIDFMYRKYYSKTYSLEEFYELNKRICKSLKAMSTIKKEESNG